MRISDWSSDVCSSDLEEIEKFGLRRYQPEGEIFLYRPCSSAIASTGYLCRTTIMEFLVMNDELRRALMRHAGMSEIAQIARQSGMRTMYEDGIVKAPAGEQTVEDHIVLTEAAGCRPYAPRHPQHAARRPT